MSQTDSISSNKYISSDPLILGGAPVIKGTRIPISRIIFLLKDGYTVQSISSEYPHLKKKTIENALTEVISNLGGFTNVRPTL